MAFEIISLNLDCDCEACSEIPHNAIEHEIRGDWPVTKMQLKLAYHEYVKAVSNSMDALNKTIAKDRRV